jgi:hypothetical protein
VGGGGAGEELAQHGRTCPSSKHAGFMLPFVWYLSGIIGFVAMTLRLTDAETHALRRQAEAEQRSMQDVARAAVREYVDRHSHLTRVDDALDILTPRYADLLDRLGRA